MSPLVENVESSGSGDSYYIVVDIHFDFVDNLLRAPADSLQVVVVDKLLALQHLSGGEFLDRMNHHLNSIGIKCQYNQINQAPRYFISLTIRHF